ncbi:hypothetical protein GCM10007304_18520 [Rhodococcoides trifolii]|uniref:Uncharacterized protein n=1 Tax=Rhodococcoides trifolii TaxID=908250 RepID=A0A917D0C8_9NOCA|nr:hypothetical protein GCM10007304_18520 [Rhodococcus trifolii]
MGVSSAGVAVVLGGADVDVPAGDDVAGAVVSGVSVDADEQDATDSAATEKNAKHTTEVRFMNLQTNTRTRSRFQNYHRTDR